MRACDTVALTAERSAGRKNGDMDYFTSSKLFGGDDVDVEAGGSGESTSGESSTASRVRVRVNIIASVRLVQV